MSIAPRLFELYRKRGFTILSGIDAGHWPGVAHAQFTWLTKDGASVTNGLGIALQELYFLESLFAVFHPRRTMVIGNSFGWSSLALGLLNPEAQVVALDAGFDQFSIEGIDLTNQLAAEAGIGVRAVKAISPQDVPQAAATLGGAVDFAFIDGLHTNEQIVLDWRAIKSVATPDAVYLFHDVHAMNMGAGMDRIRVESGLETADLLATPSGMVIAYPKSLAATLAPVLSVFAPGEDGLAAMRAIAWRHRHPRLARLLRSIAKRKNTLRRWLGLPPLPLP